MTAANADGTPLGAGNAAATVHTKETTAVNVLVVPYSGFGTLILRVTWPASDADAAAVSSSLLPGPGGARTLRFSVCFSNYIRSALFRGHLAHSACQNVAVYDFARKAWLNTPISGRGS